MSKDMFEIPCGIFRDLVARTGAKWIEPDFSLDAKEVRCGTDDFCISGANGRLLFAGGKIRGII